MAQPWQKHMQLPAACDDKGRTLLQDNSSSRRQLRQQLLGGGIAMLSGSRPREGWQPLLLHSICNGQQLVGIWCDGCQQLQEGRTPVAGAHTPRGVLSHAEEAVLVHGLLTNVYTTTAPSICTLPNIIWAVV